MYVMYVNVFKVWNRKRVWMCQVHLVFMARALAVLCQALHSLVYESDVFLVNIKPQQPQTSCSAATYTIKEL